MRVSKVLSLSLSPSIYKESKQIAKEEGRTFSELVREALRQYIESREWKKLQRYGNSKAKELKIKQQEVENLINDYRCEQKSA